jgi:hypothetical protein
MEGLTFALSVRRCSQLMRFCVLPEGLALMRFRLNSVSDMTRPAQWAASLPFSEIALIEREAWYTWSAMRSGRCVGDADR